MTKVGRLFAEEAEMEKAKLLVDIVENIISKGYDKKGACEMAGITQESYENAKKLVQTEEVFA